jgi:hypothetical protein
MDINFGIRVVDEDGNGIEGARVFVSYALTHQEDYTDSDSLGTLHPARHDVWRHPSRRFRKR